MRPDITSDKACCMRREKEHPPLVRPPPPQPPYTEFLRGCGPGLDLIRKGIIYHYLRTTKVSPRPTITSQGRKDQSFVGRASSFRARRMILAGGHTACIQYHEGCCRICTASSLVRPSFLALVNIAIQLDATQRCRELAYATCSQRSWMIYVWRRGEIHLSAISVFVVNGCLVKTSQPRNGPRTFSNLLISNPLLIEKNCRCFSR